MAEVTTGAPGPERLPSPYGIPLTMTANQLDAEEGEVIERLRALATEQHVDEPIDVPEALKRSVLVTSLDALLDWGRSNSVWPVTLGLACCAFEMIAAVMPRLIRRDSEWRYFARRPARPI